MIDRRHYTVLRVGGIKEMLRALSDVTGCALSNSRFNRNLRAFIRTRRRMRSRKRPKFKFSDHFFAKLSQMPSFSIVVKESKNQIRKTCYGFRHPKTGERVYLRIDPGSLVEFRVHLTGYVIGTRYVIPGLDAMRGPFRWEKVDRKIRQYMRLNGIIVKRRDVLEYYQSIRVRCTLARKLVLRQLKQMRTRNDITKAQYEKALKHVPTLKRLY